MSFDYDEIAITAAEIIEEFGAIGQLKQITTGAYDPAMGEAGTTTTSIDVIACVFDYSAHLVDGARIITGDKQAYLAAGPVPKVGDVLAWQGVDYRVINTKPLTPAGVNCLTELQVRK